MNKSFKTANDSTQTVEKHSTSQNHKTESIGEHDGEAGVSENHVQNGLVVFGIDVMDDPSVKAVSHGDAQKPNADDQSHHKRIVKQGFVGV